MEPMQSHEIGLEQLNCLILYPKKKKKKIALFRYSLEPFLEIHVKNASVSKLTWRIILIVYLVVY